LLGQVIFYLDVQIQVRVNHYGFYFKTFPAGFLKYGSKVGNNRADDNSGNVLFLHFILSKKLIKEHYTLIRSQGMPGIESEMVFQLTVFKNTDNRMSIANING
jgi:hypothetical protein